MSDAGTAYRLTMLRADIAASAARTRSLRVTARKTGGRRGMELLQRESDERKQRARYLAIAVLTGKECRNVDRGATGEPYRDDVCWVLRETAKIVQSVAGVRGSTHRANEVVRHWAKRGDFAMGDMPAAAEAVVRRMEGERLGRAVEQTERSVRDAAARLAEARKAHTAALVARGKHDAKYPLTTPQPAATVAPH